MANATAMSRVLDIVERAASSERVTVVCSAISGCTDALIEYGREGLEKIRARHLAIIARLFTGNEERLAREEFETIFDEMLSAGKDAAPTYGEIFSTRIIERKLACEGFSTAWADSRELIVLDDEKTSIERIGDYLRSEDARIVVAPGFIARDASGRLCTLGRGGSDYSAALYAAGADAKSLQIWTDVPGVMTTNPKTVSAARTIPEMSYKSARTMAEHGAKVLYAPTVAPAMGKGITIEILDTFHPETPGTRICGRPAPDVCSWIGLSDCREGDKQRLCLTAEGPIDAEAGIARIEASLKQAGIAASSCGAEDDHIWADVSADLAKEACSAIHKEFFEEPAPTEKNIYIAGEGAVGTALKSLVRSGVALRSNKAINLAGISSDHGFARKVLSSAPRRSVFVDCTDSEDIHSLYVPLLEAGIDIVSANRRSLAVPYVEYAAMKQAALRGGCSFRYSTTVGSALPMLESLGVAFRAGDELESIEAVVSCTMNRILSEYDGGESFASLLRRAQEEGLTESDPRMDLGGKDALRKLLILAREAGIPLEESDVSIHPILPAEFFDCGLEDFYKMLEAREPLFRDGLSKAGGKRERFVASLKRDASSPLGYKAEISTVFCDAESPFYLVSGTENVISIKGRYSAPSIIKGAGEGASNAAAGILNDILR